MKCAKPLTADEINTIRKHVNCGPLVCKSGDGNSKAGVRQCDDASQFASRWRFLATLDELGTVYCESLQREHDLQQELSRLRAELAERGGRGFDFRGRR